MNYIALAYQDEIQWANISARERALIEEACLLYEQELRQSGYLFAAEDFQNNQTAITIEIVNGKVSLTDGAAAETKKQLVQLFLITAKDLNEAIQIISKMPQTRRGPIEVRSLPKLDWQQFQI
jgi:hypothetical protein